MKCIFQRHDMAHALVPADEAAERLVRRLKPGEQCMVEARRPRNLQHHKLLFALLNKVADNLDGVSTDTLLQVIKVRTGYVNVLKTAKGEIHVPKSIAFESMPQDEFGMFWESTLRFILSDVLPGVDRRELENEVLEMAA